MPWHACCMFRPFLRPSSGILIQKSHKERCNKINSEGPLIYSPCFFTVLSFGIWKVEDVHYTSCRMICWFVQWKIPKLKFHICKTSTWYRTLISPHGTYRGYFTFCQKKKGKLMNSLEKFYIYSETLRNNQINKESTAGSNKIYDVVIQHKNDRCWLWWHACFLTRPLPHSHLNSP